MSCLMTKLTKWHARMPRLILVFAECTDILLVLSWRGSYFERLKLLPFGVQTQCIWFYENNGFMNILSTTVALFEPTEIRIKDSKLDNISWIWRIRKCTCKGFITKKFCCFRNQSWEISSNCKHGIVINAISIRKVLLDHIALSQQFCLRHKYRRA